MATLTYSKGCCCLFRILCSIICPHKLSIQPLLSVAPKRLLFVSYNSQKRAAKYSQFFTVRKQPSVNFNLLHNNYCAHAHSVTCVKIHFVRSASILVIHNAYHVHTELFSLEYFSLFSLMLALAYRQCLCLVIYPWHYPLTGSAKYFRNTF